MGELHLLDVGQQLRAVEESIKDPRPSVPTGFPSLDLLLRRGGLLPGTLVLLGGRTGTRKSTIMENMMLSMVTAGHPVGLLGLDEQPWQYVVSLMSVLSGRSRDWVEEVWDEPDGKALRRDWKQYNGKLHVFKGRKPGIDNIQAQMEMTAMGTSEAPAVIFIDYLNKLTRDRPFSFGENSRIPLLVEALAEWSTDTGVAVVALHQLSRNDEFGQTNNRNNGHLPVTLGQLKYGGEDDADIAISTYRPAMDPLGNMAKDVAQLVLGDKFDEQEFFEARSRVRKYKDSTFLQLLKNRPGTHREEKGIELLSPYPDSLRMEEKSGARVPEPSGDASDSGAGDGHGDGGTGGHEVRDDVRVPRGTE